MDENKNTFGSDINSSRPKKQGGFFDSKGQYVFPDGSYYDMYDVYHPSTHAPSGATYAFNWTASTNGSSENNTPAAPAEAVTPCCDTHCDSDPVNNDPCNSDPFNNDPCNSENHEKYKKKRSSLRTTLIVLACVFGVALIILASALIYGISDISGDPDIDRPTVNIQVSDKGPTTPNDGDASAEILEQANNSIVVIYASGSSSSSYGSGFIITSDGYIVTNQHVVDGASHVSVEMKNGKTYNATVIGESEDNDIAVLKISATDLPAITLGKSSNCHVGERVYALGCPEGYDFPWTVTAGIISNTSRTVRITDSNGEYEKTMTLIQTDTAVNSGNSGGPLINVRGEVVGIVTLKISNTAGLGFAIPIDGALEIVKALIEDGNADSVDSSVSVGRPMLGITCVGVTKDTYYCRTSTGVTVITESEAEVTQSSFHADVSGIYVVDTDSRYNAVGKLMSGDIIVSVDGSEVYTNDMLTFRLNSHKAGDVLELKIYRNGAYKTVSITLAKEITD